MSDLIQSMMDLLCGGCCLGIILLIGVVYFIHQRLPDDLRQIIRGK